MLRSASNFGGREYSARFALVCPEETLTRQSEAKDADINEIVRRFGLTGQLPVVHMPPVESVFEDVYDFQSAMNLIVAAKDAFMELPAETRRRFGNDPQEYVKFCSDPENLPEMRKMGIAVPEAAVVEVKPQEVLIVGDKREDASVKK